MSYAHANRARGKALAGFPMQELRGFPMQELRGLGSVTGVDPNRVQAVVAALDQLVSIARTQTQQIVVETRDKGLPFFRLWTADAAQEWANNIVTYVEGVRTRLLAPSRDGRAVFVAQPQHAVAMLEDTKQTLKSMIAEFKNAARSTTISATLEQAVQKAVEAVLGAAQVAVASTFNAAVKFPVGAVAAAAVVAGIVWFKFLR